HAARGTERAAVDGSGGGLVRVDRPPVRVRRVADQRRAGAGWRAARAARPAPRVPGLLRGERRRPGRTPRGALRDDARAARAVLADAPLPLRRPDAGRSVAFLPARGRAARGARRLHVALGHVGGGLTSPA